jgi:hypothetical protein
VLKIDRTGLVLTVVAPSGRYMHITVCDDDDLVSRLDAAYRKGLIWLTIPPLGEAVGPIPLLDYFEHQLGRVSHPELAALASKRIDPATLPPCEGDYDFEAWFKNKEQR